MATRTPRRLAPLALGALAAAGCMGDAEAGGPADVVFTPSTARAEILGRFPEVLNWTDVAIDGTLVPGQNRCVLTVAVSDSADADALRRAFMGIAEAGASNLCPAVVALRLVPYTRDQVDAARARIDTLLADDNAGAQVLLTRTGDVVVEVKNFPAVERAQKALAAATELPAGIVTAVKPRLWLREAESPRQPPLEAYTAVLVDLYRRNASPSTTIGVLRSSLPRGFGERNLAGLPVRIVDDPAAVGWLIRFGGATQLDDGVFMIDAAGNRSGADANVAPKPIGVDCVDGQCFLVDVLPPAEAPAQP